MVGAGDTNIRGKVQLQIHYKQYFCGYRLLVELIFFSALMNICRMKIQYKRYKQKESIYNLRTTVFSFSLCHARGSRAFSGDHGDGHSDKGRFLSHPHMYCGQHATKKNGKLRCIALYIRPH